jgi:signal transduction histidine kinase
MGLTPWLRQRSLAVFLGVMCVLGGALSWLCVQLLRQDRQLEAERLQDHLEQAADRMAGGLAWRLQEAEQGGEGTTVAQLASGALEAQPAGSLLYLPAFGQTTKIDRAAYVKGERLEFQEQDSAGAAEFFRRLTQSELPELRAGALVRLARNLRKLGRMEEALGAYAELQRISGVDIEGVPAELVASDARCRVFEAMGRRDDLARESHAIVAGLRHGRWRLSGAAWSFHHEQAVRWSSAAPLSDAEQEALTLSRAAEWVAQLGVQPIDPKGRRILVFDGRPVLISWTAVSGHLEAVLVGPKRLAAIWSDATQAADTRAALVDLGGAMLLGSVNPSGRRAVRAPDATGFPATLLVSTSSGAAELADAGPHRALLLVGFAMLALVLIAGSGFILHSMARERAVAHLQSEFVSAVSHEFRTPLTSLRQISEMLLQDRITNPASRRESYEVMYHATERLRRLVESLLDFGRMEAAAFQYRFEATDTRALVDRTVADFRAQSCAGRDIVIRHADDLPAVAADRDALTVALWNLLDNAVKYSPGVPAVWVETRREGENVAIAVRDAGIGIDAADQTRIFERFVRGAAAQRANIKGTGIGLSMARHIVQAHYGNIQVKSQRGCGSTFTIVLPAAASVPSAAEPNR